MKKILVALSEWGYWDDEFIDSLGVRNAQWSRWRGPGHCPESR